MTGCVVCGQPVSPGDGIEDRCGHHRRQLLRNQAKAKGLPPPTKKRVPKPPKEPDVLESLTPQQMREDHMMGRHTGIVRIACLLCVRERGGSIPHVEILAGEPENLKGKS